MLVEDITLFPQALKEWDEFVERSPAGTVFHSSNWLALYNFLPPPHQQMRIICCRERAEGEIIGGCTLLEKKRYGFRLAVNALATQYAGFLLPPPEGEKISATINREHLIMNSLAKYLMLRFHQVWLCSPPGVSDFRPLLGHGWQVMPAYTNFLATAELEKLWNQLDGSVRRQIKKGEQRGFRLSLEFKPTAFINLLEESFRRHHQQNPIPRELIIQVIESPQFRANRFLIGAEDNSGNLASGIIALSDSKRAYYGFAATRSDLLGSGIHSWLIWEMLKLLNQQKIYHFDFLGANIPSIARFKEKFNPQVVVYYSAIYWGSSLLRCLKGLRRLFKS